MKSNWVCIDVDHWLELRSFHHRKGLMVRSVKCAGFVVVKKPFLSLSFLGISSVAGIDGSVGFRVAVDNVDSHRVLFEHFLDDRQWDLH